MRVIFFFYFFFFDEQYVSTGHRRRGVQDNPPLNKHLGRKKIIEINKKLLKLIKTFQIRPYKYVFIYLLDYSFRINYLFFYYFLAGKKFQMI